MTPQKKHLFILLLMFLNITGVSYAQNGSVNKTLDSLLLRLKNYQILTKELNKNTTASDTLKVDLLNEICELYYQIGDNDKATEMANEAMNLSKKLKFKRGVIQTLNNLGMFETNKGAYYNAIEIYNTSLQLNEELGNKKGTAMALNNIGISYYNLGNYTKTIGCFTASLKIKEELNDTLGIANSLNNIGYIYFDLKDYKQALKYFADGLTKYQQLNSARGLAATYINIGLVYSDINNLEEALLNYNKALEIYKTTSNKLGIAKALNNIGGVYLNQKDFKQAKKYLQDALMMKEEIDDKKGICNSLIKLSELYSEMNEPQTAIDYGNKALVLAQKIDNLGLVKDASEILYEAYKKTGNFKSSLFMYEIYSAAKDSLINDQTRNEVIKQELKHNYDKKAAADSVAFAKEKLLKNIEIQKQKAELKIKKNQQYASFIGLFALVVFSLFVYNRFKVSKKQNAIIEKQKVIVEESNILLSEKNKEVLQSITYAKRIQTAILPPPRMINEFLNDTFVLYLPKDIVAGDFYWLEKVEDKIYVASCDCTGHGVPGAMISVVCNNALNRALIEFGERLPGKILDKTRELVLENFSKSDDEVQDGMDTSLAVFDLASKSLQWAGANNPLWIYRSDLNCIEEIKANKQPVGKTYFGTNFTTHHIKLQTNDIVYLFTDGYADQFGGQRLKKLTKAKFREFLLSICQLNMNQQYDALLTFHKQYKDSQEQVDDICIIGIRV